MRIEYTRDSRFRRDKIRTLDNDDVHENESTVKGLVEMERVKEEPSPFNVAEQFVRKNITVY